MSESRDHRLALIHHENECLKDEIRHLRAALQETVYIAKILLAAPQKAVPNAMERHYRERIETAQVILERKQP